MEMKTLILVTITVLVVVIPFVFVYIKNQKKNNKTKSVLTKYADRDNSKIDESDTLSNIAIGIDYDQKRLFFIKHYKNHESEQIINLNDIKNVKLINEKRSVKIGKSSTLVVEKIGIVLTNNKPINQDYTLELYNENINMVLSGEVQLANKWLTIIEGVLKQSQSKTLVTH